MAYNRNNKHEDIYTVDILFFVQAAKMCFFNTDFFMHKVTVGYFCTHTYIHISKLRNSNEQKDITIVLQMRKEIYERVSS